MRQLNKVKWLLNEWNQKWVVYLNSLLLVKIISFEASYNHSFRFSGWSSNWPNWSQITLFERYCVAMLCELRSKNQNSGHVHALDLFELQHKFEIRTVWWLGRVKTIRKALNLNFTICEFIRWPVEAAVIWIMKSYLGFDISLIMQLLTCLKGYQINRRFRISYRKLLIYYVCWNGYWRFTWHIKRPENQEYSYWIMPSMKWTSWNQCLYGIFTQLLLRK